MTNLESALRYADRGWQVFPIKPKAKEPATARGFYDASRNPATLTRWFARYPYNIAIRTGTASGCFVLDVDGDAGTASLRDLESAHAPLPQTLTSITSRGQHYWFHLAAPLPSSQSKIGVGLDIKADGGYVLVPPSIHPHGPVYLWRSYERLAVAPDWLIRLARAKPSISDQAWTVRAPHSNGQPDAYGLCALRREIGALAATPPGCRNNALNVVAFRLFQLVAGGELDQQTVEDRLIKACHDNGLIQDDGLRSVLATIRSARTGLQHPRSRRGAP